MFMSLVTNTHLRKSSGRARFLPHNISHLVKRCELPIIRLLPRFGISQHHSLTSKTRTTQTYFLGRIVIAKLALGSGQHLTIPDVKYALDIVQHLLDVAKVRLVRADTLCRPRCVEFEFAERFSISATKGHAVYMQRYYEFVLLR